MYAPSVRFLVCLFCFVFFSFRRVLVYYLRSDARHVRMFGIDLQLPQHGVEDVDLLLQRLQVLRVHAVGGEDGGGLHGGPHALCLCLQLLHYRLWGTQRNG